MNLNELYPSLKPLTHKYGEDIVQKALLKVWRLKPAVFDLPEPELVAFIAKAAYRVMCQDTVNHMREEKAIKEVYPNNLQYLNPELMALLRSELTTRGTSRTTLWRHRKQAKEAIV